MATDLRLVMYSDNEVRFISEKMLLTNWGEEYYFYVGDGYA